MSKMIKMHVSPQVLDFLIQRLSEYLNQKLEKPEELLEQPKEVSQLIAELRTLQGLRTHRNIYRNNELSDAS